MTEPPAAVPSTRYLRLYLMALGACRFGLDLRNPQTVDALDEFMSGLPGNLEAWEGWRSVYDLFRERFGTTLPVAEESNG